MQNFQFPIRFKFRISSFSNDFTAIDATGKTVAYVKQKLFKFKEDIVVYENENQAQINYRIKADRWIDFSATYTFFDNNGAELGRIGRRGWTSLWKAHYEIFDQNKELKFNIREENGWVKVMDGLLSEVPILGMFTGYFFNPSYIVTDVYDHNVVRIKKEASFWGRKFILEKLSNLEGHEDDDIILGLMMMVLLERRRG